MSAGEKDIFDAIVAGEQATEATIELLEDLATTIVDAEPASRQKLYGYQVLETHADVTFSSVFEEELEGVNGTSVTVMLHREQPEDKQSHYFSLTFSQTNELANLDFSGEASLQECLLVAQELLDSNSMDAAATSIVKHVQNVLFAMNTGTLDTIGVMKTLNANGIGNDDHVADLIREAINNRVSTELHIREYGDTIDDDKNAITIIKHDLVDAETGTPASKEDHDELEIPRLQIIYEDRQHTLLYVFSSYFNGVRSLELVRSYEDIEIEYPYNGDDGNEEIDKFISELENDVPREDDTQAIIAALVAVSVERSP